MESVPASGAKSGNRERPSVMAWTENHDDLLCREIISENPFAHKKSSPQRGQAWQDIAVILSSIREPYFKVDKRAVRDRYNLLAAKLRRKLKEEEKASGIAPVMSDVEVAIEELIEKEDAAEEQQKENMAGKKKAAADRENAEEMRAKALERLGETGKRKGDEGRAKSKRRRSNGTDTVQYLREKNEVMAQVKKDELIMQEKKQEAENQRHMDFMKHMQEQQRQQQEQMQQMQSVMMQQQQQQNQLMLALISKLVPK